MVHAVIMIRTGPGTSETVRETIETIDGVVDAHVVAGNFDVVAEVSGDEVYDVIQAASSEIQATEGVEETKTYVALD
ncbi:MAG: Lrp/AsnC ligand binding domain-containing protein [Halanaeroarchaeum sp.]